MRISGSKEASSRREPEKGSPKDHHEGKLIVKREKDVSHRAHQMFERDIPLTEAAGSVEDVIGLNIP